MWNDDCYEGKSLLSPASIANLCSSINHVFQNWLESLPQELISDILVKLPVKSLVRFTSVCKSWNSTIKNPKFIHTHLNSNPTHLLLIHNVSNEGTSKHDYGQVPISGFKLDSYSLRHDDNTAVTEIEFPISLKPMTRNPCFRVSGTCNGLVLLADDVCRDAYSYVLWNPSVRKYVILPKPRVRESRHGEYKATTGMGYDAVNKDYKVVRLTFPVDHHSHRDLVQTVQFYSLATGSWGMLRVLPPCIMVLINSPILVLANGVLHFMAYRTKDHERECLIMGFDVASESLREILLPESLIPDGLEIKLGASRDRQSIVLFVRGDCYHEIWVMKEYSVQKSWTKLVILTPQGPERSLHRAMCFTRSGEVVLQLENDRRLVLLDIESKQFKQLGISAGLICSGDSYEESLVLLDRKDAISY